MKSLLVFVCLVVAIYADLKEYATEFKAVVKEVGTNCLSEVGATSDDLDSLLMRKEIPTKHEAKCLILCMHKHWGVQNSDGKLDYDAAIKSISPLQEIDADIYGKMSTVFKTCMDQVEEDSDPCVTATNLAKCGKEQSEKLGLEETYDV